MKSIDFWGQRWRPRWALFTNLGSVGMLRFALWYFLWGTNFGHHIYDQNVIKLNVKEELVKQMSLCRSFGVHMSKVRSITLDAWEPELLKVMAELGNDVINRIYEANLDDSIAPKPDPDSKRWAHIGNGVNWFNSRMIKKLWVCMGWAKNLVQMAVVVSFKGGNETLLNLANASRQKCKS